MCSLRSIMSFVLSRRTGLIADLYKQTPSAGRWRRSNAKADGNRYSVHRRSQEVMFVTSSQPTPFLSEIAGADPLSEHSLAYLCERVRNNYYDYVIRKFLEAEAERGFTKADLARKLNKGADRISKVLGAPGNWTLDTITELLAAISAEELLPYSEPILDRGTRNHTQHDLIQHCSQTKTYASNDDYAPSRDFSAWRPSSSNNAEIEIRR